MALKGLDIFKLTPKTNCKDCGNPTCMAFAMKVASGALPIETVSYTHLDVYKRQPLARLDSPKKLLTSSH